MNFGFIADIHLSKYAQDKLEDKTNLPERLASIQRALYEVSEHCLNNKISTIVMGGDLLHNKSVIYTIAQNILIDYFDNNSKLNFIVIDGNHDLSGKGTDAVSALKFLKHIPNVEWIAHNRVETMDNILFVPYSYEVPKVVKENSADILISHFGLNEGVLNSGLSIISDVSVKDLVNKYKLVLVGHYHKPQEILADGFSLYYSGSLIQLDWGEKGDDKRFLVVDSETLDVEIIPTTSYKKHVELELTESNKEEVLKLAEEAKKRGDHLKVVMKERVDLQDVKGEFNIIDKTERDITDRGISSSMSQEDILKRFLEVKEIPEKDIKTYFNVAKEIIDKCEEI